MFILSLDWFANAKLFRLSYAVHRYDTLFRKPVPCRYINQIIHKTMQTYPTNLTENQVKP